MDLITWLHAAGGPLLLVGAWLQGEAAVILGGALAHQGVWPWWEVWLVAAVPATLGHELYYVLGRRFGARLLERLPTHWQPAVDRARRLISRHDARILLAMRFAYGVRLPLPILCGSSGVPAGRFLVYNVGTALGWALLFTLIGFVFGAAATAAFRQYAHFQALFLVAGVVFAFCVRRAGRRLGDRLG